MRLRRLTFALLAGLFVTGSAGAESGTADLLGGVLRLEYTGLRNVSLDRLSAFTSAGIEVKYTSSWLNAQPNVGGGGADYQCLAEALYFEARGETVKGMFAVAEVIMNRVDSPRFPNTACAVIHQGTGRRFQCQFTYTCDGNPEVYHEPAALERVRKVARAMFDGAPRTLTGGATYYHTTAVYPRWARTFVRTASIGVHRFYRKG